MEVLGLRLGDVQAGSRRLFIVEGKGGRQRILPVSSRFFTVLGAYLDLDRERPATETENVLVVLIGARRGLPLSAAGLDEILDGAKDRAGLQHATCHELRHTCFTRLREAGMALEAIQAQAGHASIETTRIYLHLADGWLADEYRRAAEAIEAQIRRDRRPTDDSLTATPGRAGRGPGRRLPGRPARGRDVRHAPGDVPARSFLSRVGVNGWDKLSTAEQCATPLKDRRVAGWLMVTGRLRPSPDYLVLGKPLPGRDRGPPPPGVPSTVHHHVRPARLRPPRVSRLQWSALVKVAVLIGLAPDQITVEALSAGRAALITAIREHRPVGPGATHLTGALFGAHMVLFHAGVFDAPPCRQSPDQPAARAAAWAGVTPVLATTLLDYFAQTRMPLRPATMVRIEGVLREFACWLSQNAPSDRRVADLRRAHIEAYKL